VRLYVSWSFAVESRLLLQKRCGEKGVVKIEYNGCLISVFELVLGAVLDERLFSPPVYFGVGRGTLERSLQSLERVEPDVGFN
jgi:hypothetical protein